MIQDLSIYDGILVSNQKETTKMKIKKKKATICWGKEAWCKSQVPIKFKVDEVQK